MFRERTNRIMSLTMKPDEDHMDKPTETSIATASNCEANKYTSSNDLANFENTSDEDFFEHSSDEYIPGTESESSSSVTSSKSMIKRYRKRIKKDCSKEVTAEADDRSKEVTTEAEDKRTEVTTEPEYRSKEANTEAEDKSKKANNGAEDGNSVSQKGNFKGAKRNYMKKMKMLGQQYTSRKGIVHEAKNFVPLEKCCRKNCYNKISAEMQELIHKEFYEMGDVFCQDQKLMDGVMIYDKKACKKGRGADNTRFNDRLITVKYVLVVNGMQTEVCKTFFQNVYSITRGKCNVIIQKKNNSKTGISPMTASGKHPPRSEFLEERDNIINHIKSFPRFQSHYSRRHTNKFYLSHSLNISKMYELYVDMKKGKGEKPASYRLYCLLFKKTGYKIKKPAIDTCKKCDTFKTKIKHASPQERLEIEKNKLDHEIAYELAYRSKDEDKKAAKENSNEKVIVFDLQKCLPTPDLATNEIYYKRQLWTLNETVRDTTDGTTYCYMWHEAISGRGSDDIASCLHKHIEQNVPNCIKHLTTYSDTCSAQNRNINFSIMMILALKKHPSLELIDQKFLEPGHTHLECDADHARIERAKKSSDIQISIPHDWFQFVRTVRGKLPVRVVEMKNEDFLSFSSLVKDIYVKRTKDTMGVKINWLNIRWIQYTKNSDVIAFKYTLDRDTPFRMLNLLKNNRYAGRPRAIIVPLSQTGPVPINPNKKKDLISILPLLDPVYHSFYNNLTTNSLGRITGPENDSSTDCED